LISIIEQKLTVLTLAANAIFDHGVQHLASALENPTAKHSFYTYVSRQPVQSLTTLNLAGNGITHQGIQYLAQAIQNNKVK
jgi:Ran GTPase-activating protein (RanGAP) involved in mRNA processing and transport